MIRGGVVALLLALAPPLGALPLRAGVPEPPAYRMDHFRDPVPDTLKGAQVVTVEEAHALWQGGQTLMVDVLPRPPKPANLPPGTIWRVAPRLSIPGAIWLPNVGYGALAPVTDAWFRDTLARATGGDRDRAILFFCLDSCWMSWNAARRAMLEYGYTRVIWFPGGTDHWEMEDFPLEELHPAPGQPQG